MFKDFTENELNSLIENKIEESLHLEYKSGEVLSKMNSDPQRRDSYIVETSRDVSAFANSDGGYIIYGISEGSKDNKDDHLPKKINPVKREEFSKERLEQIITSNISPRIDGLKIHPIEVSSEDGNVVYVVEIPKSHTVHQARDKIYYKRRNFERSAMEDYEVKDTINRSVGPKLSLVLDSNGLKVVDGVLEIPIVLNNSSYYLAKDVNIFVEVKGLGTDHSIQESLEFRSLSSINNGKSVFGIRNPGSIRVFNGVNLFVGKFSLKHIHKDNPSIISTQDHEHSFTDLMQVIISVDKMPTLVERVSVLVFYKNGVLINAFHRP